MADGVISAAISRFAPITLPEMDAVKLMNRIDTKYVTTQERLEGFLEDAASRGYRALELDGQRLCRYDSLYYDTPELNMYVDHHNRRIPRRKVRVRTYLESGTSYLEVKRKNNHGRTKKKRRECSPDSPFAGDNAAFVLEKSGFDSSVLSPACSTSFRRITLVSPSMSERLTIDLDLHFSNRRSGREGGLGTAVIIELKQDGNLASATKGLLREHRIRPLRVSKYAIGTALTGDVRKGRFLPKIRRIEKIIDNKLI